jgi:hypothetical protein
MNNVSLTYFVDFVLKSGTPKLTVVRDFKNRDAYDPQTDFYKPLREKLVESCRSGQPTSNLETWAGTVHEKKKASYLAVVAGLKKFIGRKQYTWFDPPKQNHAIGALTLNVNPELGLDIHGVHHVVKVYLKDDPPLTKPRIQIILHVMEQALTDPSTPRTFAVLDARKGRLHTSGPQPTGIAALLAGEAAAFATMFAQV